MQESGMTIVADIDGTMDYYVPPPPPKTETPPNTETTVKTGTNAPGFQGAVNVAKQATTAYQSGHGSATTVDNDWSAVEEIIANQYRIALTSSDPKAAVAALNRQYANYFQGQRAPEIYSRVVADGRDIATELQHRYGNANNGVYTTAQVKAAAAALGQSDPVAAISTPTQKTSQAIAALGKSDAHAPGAPDQAAAMNAVESDGFDQEVMIYEQTQREGYAAPGSRQWRMDAQALLNNPAALQAARDAVAAENMPQLAASGISVQQFGADLWAGETAAQAQLTQESDENPPLVCPANGADLNSMSPMERREQGEWDALSSLSQALNGLPSSGVDPTLARQALMANSYVGALAGEINKTMQAVAAGNGATPGDAITFLEQTVKNIDPQLATVVVSASAKTLQTYLNDQSTASAAEAAQAFASTAGIYYAMLTAGRAGVPGAQALADDIGQWSYAAADNTPNIPTSTGKYSVSSGYPSRLAQMLQQVLSTAQQQKVPPQLLRDWRSLAKVNGQLRPVYGGDGGNAPAWISFQQSLDGAKELAVTPLPPATPLTPPSSAQTPDQVHATYEQALMGLEQNGDLPSTVDPAAAAAAQTMMSPGYVANTADTVALARAMITDKALQLDDSWFQQDAGEGLIPPVDFFTAQAAVDVTGLGAVPSSAVQQALRGMEAPLPTAPSYSVINATNSAFEALQSAEASGNKTAIAQAQQAMNQAIANELLSVYPDQFPGNTLLTNDENADWRILAEWQVAQDHADDPQLESQLPALLEAGEITQAAIDPSNQQQSVVALDQALAPYQQLGNYGNAVIAAVVNDARVQALVHDQVKAATQGLNPAAAATALAHEAQFIAPYEESDPNGPVASLIVAGTLAAPVTQQLLTTAKQQAQKDGDPLAVAAPLMQAAQQSPALTLAIYNDFNLPAAGHQPSDATPPNGLVKAAGNLRTKLDYRNAAIIYATLPDNPQVDGVAALMQEAQAAKSAMITAVGAQLGGREPNKAAVRNLPSWIRASFAGPNSAPDWLAQDLVSGYQYQQGGQSQTVGALTNQRVVSAINGALYQSNTGNGATSPTPPAPDFVGQQDADGLTLQEFGSADALESYVGAAYQLRPDANGTYDPQTIVYGKTTLAKVVRTIEQQAGVTTVSLATPVVVQAVPVEVNGQLVSAFRVQEADGSQIWIGPDGKVSSGWAGQDEYLTGDQSNTVTQVVGGVSDIDAQGDANPLLKINAPPPPSPSQHPWWESVLEDAGAMVVGAIVAFATENPLLGAVAAFAFYQAFDQVTDDGNVTIFDMVRDAAEGKANRATVEQFLLDSGSELIQSLADGYGPLAGKWAGNAVAGLLASRLGLDSLDAATETTVKLTTRLAAKALATGTGVATNQAVQGAADLATTGMQLDAANKFTWSRMGDAAAEQGLNLVPAFLTGGLSGALPESLLIQTAVGLGSNLGQTEVDDAVFDHHNLTRDDVISALIYTPASTLIDLADRPDSPVSDLLSAPVKRWAPALYWGSGRVEGDPSSIAIEFEKGNRSALESAVADGRFTPGKDWAYVYAADDDFKRIGYAEVRAGEGQTAPQLVWRGDKVDSSTSESFEPYLQKLDGGKVHVVMSDAAPGRVLKGGDVGDVFGYSAAAMAARGETNPSVISVAFGRKDASALEKAVKSGRFTAGKDWAYVYEKDKLVGYAEVTPGEGKAKPQLVWRGDDLEPTKSQPFASYLQQLEEGDISVVMSDAAPNYALDGGDLLPVIRYSPAAMAYRQLELDGGLAEAISEVVKEGARAANLKGIAETQAREAVAAAERGYADAAASKAAGKAKARAKELANSVRPEDVAAARSAAEDILKRADDALERAKTNEKQLATLVAKKEAQARETRKTGTDVDQWTYQTMRKQLAEADKAIAGIERQIKAEKGRLTQPGRLTQRWRASFLASIKESESADAARLEAVTGRVHADLQTSTAKAIEAAEKAVSSEKGERTLGNAAIQAVIRNLGNSRPDEDTGMLTRAAAWFRSLVRRPGPDPIVPISQAMVEAVTARATALAQDAARAAADREVNAKIRKTPDLAKVIEAGERKLGEEFADKNVVQHVLTRSADSAREAAARIAQQTAEDLAWAKRAQGLTMSRAAVNFLAAKVVGGHLGGFYDEAPLGLPNKAAKWLIKLYDDEDTVYIARLNNELLKRGMGGGHVSDVRVIHDMLESQPAFGTGSRMLANVEYPSSKDPDSLTRFLSPDAARNNGLFDYLGMMLLTGAVEDPIREDGEGVGFIATRSGDKAQILDVDSGLGMQPDGEYRKLATKPRAVRKAIEDQIKALRSHSPYAAMERTDEIVSVRKAVGRLTEEEINKIVDRYQGLLSKARLEEIRQGLLMRRRILLEMYPEVSGDEILRDDLPPPENHWASKLNDINLSKDHGRFWSFPARFAEGRRFVGGRKWEILSQSTRADAPDANYDHQPIDPTQSGMRAKVKVSRDSLGRKAVATTGLLVGMAVDAVGLGYVARILPSSWSDALSEWFSISRGFLNTGKLQGKIRKVAYGGLERQTDITRLFGDLQNYHISLENALKRFQSPRYRKYVTIPDDTAQHLRSNTENLLGALVDIVREGQGDHQTMVQRTQIQNELKTYLAAQDRIMGVGTVDLQRFSQATDLGAAIQLGLAAAYVATLALNVNTFIAEGLPRTVGHLATTLPEYVNDVGKIGSLLNALNAGWARFTTDWPFKPRGAFAKLVKRLEPIGNLLQGIGNFVGGVVSLASLQGPSGESLTYLAEVLVGWAYGRRGVNAMRGRETEEQEAADSATTALGGGAQGGFGLAETMAEIMK
jgi:hypothetical protein